MYYKSNEVIKQGGTHFHRGVTILSILFSFFPKDYLTIFPRLTCVQAIFCKLPFGSEVFEDAS